MIGKFMNAPALVIRFWKKLNVFRLTVKKKVWEEKYTEEGDSADSSYEWFMAFDSLQPILTALVSRNARVLHIGCGNSNLGVDLHLHGMAARGVVNTDISPTVIRQMSDKWGKILSPKRMKWLVDDVLCMDLGPATFDCVVDKGTLDAIMCNLDQDLKKHNTQKVLDEVHRVLKPGGNYVVISFGQPEVRTPYFLATGLYDNICWYALSPSGDDNNSSSRVKTTKRKQTIYIYNLRKGTDVSPLCYSQGCSSNSVT